MSIYNKQKLKQNEMKKLKLNILSIITFCVFSIIIIACSNDTNEINNLDNLKTETLSIKSFDRNSNTTVNYINEKYSIKFTSELKDNKVNSTTNLFDKNTNELIQSTKFVLDKNLPSYKLSIFKKIEKISSDIKVSLTKSEWVGIKNSYERFVKKLLNDIDNEMHKSDLIQSTFYHLSIFNTVIRSFDINDCECTPLPAYFVGKSSFWCQEDYMFDRNQMQEYFGKNKKQLLDYKNGRKVYDYVMNYKNDNKDIPFIEIYKLMYSIKEFREIVENNFNSVEDTNKEESCLLGSDLGCCGNYSGCCWLSSLTCLLHDIECIGCTHWHCGWACVP